MIGDSLGFIDERTFSEALSRADQDPSVSLAGIVRTIGLEVWTESSVCGSEYHLVREQTMCRCKTRILDETSHCNQNQSMSAIHFSPN